ncbi:MAG: hypothetical protein WA988_07340 [Candidatus Nanopelagicales bacterium]
MIEREPRVMIKVRMTSSAVKLTMRMPASSDNHSSPVAVPLATPEPIARLLLSTMPGILAA